MYSTLWSRDCSIITSILCNLSLKGLPERQLLSLCMHNPIRAKWYIVFHTPLIRGYVFALMIRKYQLFFQNVLWIISRYTRMRIYLISAYLLWANIINFLFIVFNPFSSLITFSCAALYKFSRWQYKNLCVWILIGLASTKTGQSNIFIFLSFRIDFMYDASRVATYMYNATNAMHAEDIRFESPYCRNVRESDPCLYDIFNSTSCYE